VNGWRITAIAVEFQVKKKNCGLKVDEYVCRNAHMKMCTGK